MTHVVVPVLPLGCPNARRVGHRRWSCVAAAPRSGAGCGGGRPDRRSTRRVEEGRGRSGRTALLERAVACADRTAHGPRRIFPRLVSWECSAALAGWPRPTAFSIRAGPLLADEPDGRWNRHTDLSSAPRVQLAAGRLTDAVDDALARASSSPRRREARAGSSRYAWLTLAVAALDANPILPAPWQRPPGTGMHLRHRERRASAGPRTPGCTAVLWTHGRPPPGVRHTPCDLRRFGRWHQQLLLEVPAVAGGLVRLALREGDRYVCVYATRVPRRLAGVNPDRPIAGGCGGRCPRHPGGRRRPAGGGDLRVIRTRGRGPARPRTWARSSSTTAPARGACPFLDGALEEYERAGCRP